MFHDHEKRADLTVRWTRVQPNIAAFIRSVVRDPNDVDDVLQDTAYRVAVKFDEYDAGRPFVAWAIGIARNCIFEWHRSSGRELHLFDDATIRRVADTYADRAPQHDRFHVALEECLAKLTANSRRLLDLRYAQGLKPARIADELGSTSASISSTLYRVRESLRQCIESARAGGGEAPS